MSWVRSRRRSGLKSPNSGHGENPYRRVQTGPVRAGKAGRLRSLSLDSRNPLECGGGQPAGEYRCYRDHGASGALAGRWPGRPVACRTGRVGGELRDSRGRLNLLGASHVVLYVRVPPHPGHGPASTRRRKGHATPPDAEHGSRDAAQSRTAHVAWAASGFARGVSYAYYTFSPPTGLPCCVCCADYRKRDPLAAKPAVGTSTLTAVGSSRVMPTRPIFADVASNT